MFCDKDIVFVKVIKINLYNVLRWTNGFQSFCGISPFQNSNAVISPKFKFNKFFIVKLSADLLFLDFWLSRMFIS